MISLPYVYVSSNKEDKWTQKIYDYSFKLIIESMKYLLFCSVWINFLFRNTFLVLIITCYISLFVYYLLSMFENNQTQNLQHTHSNLAPSIVKSLLEL